MPERDPVPLLSVVIPALDEATTIGGLLADLRALSVPYEVVVVDGGSQDGTLDVCRAAGARVLETARGRGLQLRAGAGAARAPLLAFLHADVRLAPAAVAQLDRVARTGTACALAFRLRIDAPGPSFRLIEWGANLRSGLLGLPWGDQGLIVSRNQYLRAGGYPDIPLMEDVVLVRALGRLARVRLLDAPVHVSARRWRSDGPLRRMLGNWLLLARYLAGTPPERLAARYRPEGAPHG